MDTSLLELFLKNAISIHDPYSNGHGKETAHLALLIALAIPDDVNVSDLQTAARLHDIGKLFVPRHIINKVTKLDLVDINTIRNHVNLGYYAIANLPISLNILDVILHHHENYDGSGYPHGLENGEITSYSRIIRIVDSYDAMVSDRPYRVAKTKEEAIAEIEKGIGTEFDPDYARVFIDIMLRNNG